jgi:hypothetical protein
LNLLHHTRSSRLLGEFDIKTVHLPAKKRSDVIRSTGNVLRLKVLEVCSIPCEFVKVYIRQDRAKQRVRNIPVMYLCVSRTRPQWQNTALNQAIGSCSRDLSTSQKIRLHGDCSLHTNNINREEELELSKAWKQPPDY